jgi:hypothetical protein
MESGLDRLLLKTILEWNPRPRIMMLRKRIVKGD